MMAAVAAADEANPTTDGPSTEGETSIEIEGMKEWKETYEAYLSQWHAESAEARKKALETRVTIEKQREEEAKKGSDSVKAQKAAQKAQEKKERDAQRLKEELEGKAAAAAKAAQGQGSGEREQKVKEAWEMIKAAGEGEVKEVTTDARGATAEDFAGGQALPAGQSRPPVQQASFMTSTRSNADAQTAYDPTTSTEPLPPSMTDTPSPSRPAPTDSAAVSRHSATSQAWEEISGPSSSSHESQESGDIVKVPHPRFKQPEQAQNPPPAAPPSLTLSLFTMPGHLSFRRVMAVFGINLILPFVNGVMLGFGEIFAREAVRVGRVWYREGGSFFGHMFGRRQGGAGEVGGAGGRGVAGVGLSGSGGFP